MSNNKDEQIQKLEEEMKNHPGFGKPLPSHLFTGDVLSNFMNSAKEAGYLPPFVALQKEIRDKIIVVRKLKAENKDESEINKLIDEINTKIKKYNDCCPPKMQRGRISLEGIDQQYNIWE